MFYSVEGEYQLVTWSRDNTLRLCRYESSAKSKVYISFMCAFHRFWVRHLRPISGFPDVLPATLKQEI